MRSVSTGDARSQPGSSFRRQLKRATADLHRRLESDLGLLAPDLTLERYRKVLECFFGFYAPIEAELAHVASASDTFGLPLRARTERIESDLISLGLSRREILSLPRCDQLPPLSSTEQGAGCLYVLEGASLGGRVIAPVLQERLGVTQGNGASFFVGDGEQTQARWSAFLDWLEGLVQAGAATAEIIASARATFLAFVLWAER